MELKLLEVGARYAVIEIIDGGLYFTEFEYTLMLCGEPYLHTGKAVTFVPELEPDTLYSISVNGCDEELSFRTLTETATINVAAFGASGKDDTDVTAMLQAAVFACPDGGRVLVPAGSYTVTSLFLKSGISLELAKDAVITAAKQPFDFPLLPAESPALSGCSFGTWDGSPADMYASVINAFGCENIRIYGEGTIKGSGCIDTWWHQKGYALPAARPRLLYFFRCSSVSVAGISLCNSPSWTIHPYRCQKLSFLSVGITNPYDSPDTEGIVPESCSDVVIAGTRISSGSDCVAINAGNHVSPDDVRERVAAENVHIYRCLMEEGSGAVAVGSGISGSINGLRVDNCFFRNTDRGLRIKTRRGRGNNAFVDDIELFDIEMDNVMTPFVINGFYDCGPDGKSVYVQTHKPQHVDDRTPGVGNIVLRNIICRRCHVAAAFLCGLPEMKIESVTLENVGISFSRNPRSAVPDMLSGVEPCAARGIIAENIKRLSLKNITIQGACEDVYSFADVDEVCME